MDDVHVLVKAYPKPKRTLIGGLILLALALLLGLVGVLIDYHSPALPFALVLAAFGCIALLSLPRIKRLDQRRQAAARGESTLLATTQPTPHEAALPIIINIRPNVSWQLIFYVLWLPPLMFLAGIAALLPGDYSFGFSQHGILSDFPLIFAGSAGSAALGFLLSILGERERIEATSEGLLLSTGAAPAKTWQIRWEEAQLFTISGGKANAQVTEYELSSPTTIARWRRMNRIRWFSSAKPALPFDEYDRQMEALLSLIAARTGLPLYDLRG